MLRAQSRLSAKNSDYPGHREWVERTIEQIAAATGKRALVATWDRQALGALIYKQDPNDASRVEARTIAVRAAAAAKGLPVAQFLIAMFPHVAAGDFPDATTAVCDMKVTNHHMIKLTTDHGWQPVGATHLVSPYGTNGVPDLVMTLDLTAATAPQAGTM